LPEPIALALVGNLVFNVEKIHENVVLKYVIKKNDPTFGRRDPIKPVLINVLIVTIEKKRVITVDSLVP
jgi:hypothetical protein